MPLRARNPDSWRGPVRGDVYKVLRPWDDDRSLVSFAGNDFRDLEVDASGKLYGTTGACSTKGTVWQLTPQP